MDFKGSKTEKNLYKTFAGESRARSKYTLYAEKATEEGYEWIAEVFKVTAHNELAHSREVFEWLKLLGTTKENLIAAISGETDEFTNIYKVFEEEARSEGFNEIADLYKEIREAEENHNKRFSKILDKLENGEIFKEPDGGKWICMNCGYVHEGNEVPMNCPLCKYPRAYYKPYCENTNE